jgi:hypothetical protein
MADSGRESFHAVRESARANGRLVVGDGIEWSVYELPPMAYDRRGSASLVFESADAFRRVRTFPIDWQTLDDAELYAVSRQS